MELKSLSKNQAKLIKEIKETIFSSLNINPYSLVSLNSAYEIAWIAMIPNHRQPSEPMFEGCLSWVLNNQTEHGFWGNNNESGMPTLGSLTATLACVVALKKWNVGSDMISKGLEFIHSSNAKRLLKEMKEEGFIPQWFAIIFPGMIELAEQILNIQILKDESVVVSNIFYHRQLIFQKEQHHNKEANLLSYLEVLPLSYFNKEEDYNYDIIIKKLCEEGSFFQSPSATACAFMATQNSKCLHYLQTLVHTFSNNNIINNITIVPTTYPMDEDLIKLCVINHVERLGLAEHFSMEIEQLLQHTYKNYVKHDGEFFYKKSYHSVVTLELHLLKESLAFRLLRMHGYKVFPSNICWFMKNEKIKNCIESNYESFLVTTLNLYRATDFAFHGEHELDELRTFSRKLLEKSISVGARHTNPFNKLIEHELSLSWMARLDHLEHRVYIEATDQTHDALWMGKSSQRLLSVHNDKLVCLANLNYRLKQSLFKTELEHLTRWCKEWGLSEMGFGREKSTYCYFAVASVCCSLDYNSPIRMMIAKSAILITITDDFFDMKGSIITELNTFTKAVQRWDGEGLCGVSKKIFDALDNHVKEMAITMYLDQQEKNHDDITNWLKEIWYETICSWLTESEWSKSGIVPTMDEYLKVGMTSIATHTLLIPASFLLKSGLKMQSMEYENITKLVMIICRLLNDIQSYEKEKDEGKPNSITIYMKNNSEVEMEEAVKYVKEILNNKKKELLKHVLIDDDNSFTNLSKECRLLHLSCLKVFQMFFNSSNRYDSNTEILDDIAKAIYVPLKSSDDHEGLKKNLMIRLPKPLTIDPSRGKSTTVKCSLNLNHFNQTSKYFSMNEVSFHKHNEVENWKITTHIMPSKFNFCFI
ncbi:hypothetical protein CsatB_000070 [Cannabis sativa]